MVRYLVLIVLFTCSQSPASTLRQAGKIADAFLDIGFSRTEVCKDIKEIKLDGRNQELFDKGLELRSQYHFCNSVDYFSSIYRSVYLDSEDESLKFFDENLQVIEQSLFKMSESYQQVQEYVRAINEINQFIDKSKVKTLAETENKIMFLYKKLRHEIVSLTVRLMDNSVGEEKLKWAQYLMGQSQDQVKENLLLQNLVIQNYIDEFSNQIEKGDRGIEKTELNKLKSKARQIVSQSYIQQALDYKIKKEYRLALEKLSMILKWGPQNELFDNALMETRSILEEYSMALLDPYFLSDQRLANDLKVDVHQITKELRESLSQKAQEQLFKLADR